MTPDLFHQAYSPPFDSKDKFYEFVENIRSHHVWNDIGFLTDENYHNQVFLLFSESCIASFRLNMDTDSIVEIVGKISVSNKIEYRHLQGHDIKNNDLTSIEALNDIWFKCKHQSALLKLDQYKQLLNKIDKDNKEKGRGKNFSTKTINQVLLDSHNRCMFEGCGEQLNLDELTGEKGNYGYNAHNVASSESGPRGILYLSDHLSDDPDNVLLLCDKHHRLIDRIALADFPASKLSKMRSEFTNAANSLLDGLKYQPIPVYSVLWPVGGYSSSSPEAREIAACLAQIKSRILGARIDIDDNDILSMRRPEIFTQNIDEIVKCAANEILGQIRRHGFRAALFAFGPMPALVGLGAVLGNKNEITPMLRFRDGNCWMWPQNKPTQSSFSINDQAITSSCKEVVILVAFTNNPLGMQKKAEELGFPIIKVLAKTMGNSAIPHPDNGRELRVELQRLFQRLKDENNIIKIHLLVCASNAACVFIGQAIDLHQPEFLVYDFSGESMEPRLVISTKENRIFLGRP